ncbi:hypothetical protein [Actinomadura sp. 6N118]|uniref:hypothetical protein n=1 Tax=Actinomadura sp. 6N118 TaxID=3375151 RepID=UPI0037A9C675
MFEPRDISRRGLLTGAGAAALLTTLPTGVASAASRAAGRAAAGSVSAAGPLPDLAKLGPIARTAFAPAEQRVASYLVSLAPMVNGISDADADYGFFTGGWWRTPANATNARVQEHVLTLAWFYAKARSWNPYSRDPALLVGLDAALGHYLGLQHPDGSWPEYSGSEHSLAATGFALGYLSKVQSLLRSANALPARRTQITAALRKAMTWLLNPSNESVWQNDLTFANQVTAGLAGSALALRQDPNATLRSQLTSAIGRLAANGQSPAGFFYEESGADMNYNFEVMLPEMADCWRQSGDSRLVRMTSAYTDWLGYNMLREPDGSGWITNIAPSSRTSTLFYNDTRPDPERTALNGQFVPDVPSLGAFLPAREDLAAARKAWAAAPAPIPALVKPDTSPRIIAHGLYDERFATRKDKGKAIARLPYLKSKHFTERRIDLGQEFLFLRRRDLYLGGYFGTRRATTHSRTGLTFLWHPVAGTVIQSLNNNDHGCWATVFPGQVADADGPQPVEFLGRSAFRFRTPTSSVVTTVTAADGRLTRSVRATSAAGEQIPLVLRASDTVVFTNGTRAPYGGSVTTTADGLDLHRRGGVVRFRWGGPRTVSFRPSSVYLLDGARRTHILLVQHDGNLDLSIRLAY